MGVSNTAGLFEARRIIQDQFGCSIMISANTRLVESLGADEVDLVEIVWAIESETGVPVPDEEAETLRSVGDVIRCVRRRMEAEAA
jgi:acyl carrier protein